MCISLIRPANLSEQNLAINLKKVEHETWTQVISRIQVFLIDTIVHHLHLVLLITSLCLKVYSDLIIKALHPAINLVH